MTIYLNLSAFTSSPVSLLTTNKDYNVFFIVITLPPKILISSASTRSLYVPFNFKPNDVSYHNIIKLNSLNKIFFLGLFNKFYVSN